VYGLSQTEASKKMGMSQPAISQYKKDIRGRRPGSLADDQGFMRVVDDIAKRLAEGSVTPEQMPLEMCRFCRVLEL
jgi:predicted transcriptional regulator